MFKSLFDHIKQITNVQNPCIGITDDGIKKHGATTWFIDFLV